MTDGKGVFVTATGTDVGKTYVTALIVKKLREAGHSAGYYKAALSGVDKTAEGFRAGDAGYVAAVAGIAEAETGNSVSYVYEKAVSPHLAAKLEGNPVKMAVVMAAYERALARNDYVTMEGSGGIVCPLRYDEDAQLLLEDVITALGLGALVVADAGLGTINATVLTVDYMKRRGIPVKGIILNRYDATDAMMRDNKKMVEILTRVPIIACVKEHDEAIRIDAAVLAGLYE
nr:dethiobiotin synthase [uncultured Trichococcus sp.]